MITYQWYPDNLQTSPYTMSSRYICRICGQKFVSPYTHYLHINYTCPNISWRHVDTLVNKDETDESI
jgi:hypothetical protein